MSFNLATVKPTKALRPPRLIIHGPAGIGKSTFAASAHQAIFLNLNDGLDGINSAKFPIHPDKLAKDPDDPQVFENFQQVTVALDALITEPHDFRTVVVDTLSDLEQLILARVCLEKEKKTIEDIGYGKGYKFALAHWVRFLQKLDTLRDKRRMAVILLAHSQVKKYDDPLSESYDRFLLDINEHAAKLVTKWADGIFFANHRIVNNVSDGGFGRKINRAKSSGRVLYTRETMQYTAKNRYTLPEYIEFDYSKFMAAFVDSVNRNYKDVEQQEAKQQEEIESAESEALMESALAEEDGDETSVEDFETPKQMPEEVSGP